MPPRLADGPGTSGQDPGQGGLAGKSAKCKDSRRGSSLGVHVSLFSMAGKLFASALRKLRLRIHEPTAVSRPSDSM